ncbi:MAG: PAS domain S-box protein, partial [Bacteroidales bacterium]|nr:PAS domain S-box protein [Bacteroidales bacterium]
MEERNVQTLLAENARLKRMMKRIYGSAYGAPFNNEGEESLISTGYLPLYLSSILSSDEFFRDRIIKTLEVLGQFADVSRIYIFENHEDSINFSNTYEWCNEGVNSEKENLQNLSYDQFTEWRRMLVEENIIKATNIKDLPDEVYETLNDQGIQSILVYPLWVKEEYYGFIGFDECSFNREWLPHEIDLLQMAARLIANAYDHEAGAVEIRRSHAEILKVNKELADKERFLQSILSSAPVGIMLVRNRVIEYINEATLLHSGYSKDELVGQNIANLYFEGRQDDSVIQQFYQNIQKNGIATMDAHMRDKFGEELVIRVLGTPAPQSVGNDCYLIIGEDITQSKKTEVHLRESEERNRKLIEATIDGILIINCDLKLMYANTSACEMLHYTQEEIFERTVRDIFPSDEYVQRFNDSIVRVKQGEDFRGDTRLLNKDGQIVHAEIYLTTLNLEGNLHYYVSIHNITKRINNEVSLRNSEEKFRALTENSPDNIIRIDSEGLLSYCNQAFLNDFALNEYQCLGVELGKIKELPRELVDGLSNGINTVVKSGVSANVELEFRFKDVIRAFDWTITPETNNAELSSLLIVGRDYTQKKKA